MMTSDRPAPGKPRTAVEIIEVGAEHAGQRIDNFLIKYMKGVPKTRLYRALRGGEVRVNGGRKKAPYQLRLGDKLRLPPLRRSAPSAARLNLPKWLETIRVLFEDECLLVVDKPAGLAVHGGAGMHYGLIEALRQLRPATPYLELAHRLDRETSGCLMLAKSRAALLGLHAQLGKERNVMKNYTALVKGAWVGGVDEITTPLSKRPAAKSRLDKTGRDTSGVKGRRDDPKLRESISIFSPKESWPECALIDIRLLTGRMHQARLHAAAIGRPIAGDRLHGDREFNRIAKQAGLTRLFLHAERLRFRHPLSGAPIKLHSPLPESLRTVLTHLRRAGESPDPSPE